FWWSVSDSGHKSEILKLDNGVIQAVQFVINHVWGKLYAQDDVFSGLCTFISPKGFLRNGLMSTFLVHIPSFVVLLYNIVESRGS
ncbi:hypothetical protein MKW98_002247, partial [Papaver atlanticum]